MGNLYEDALETISAAKSVADVRRCLTVFFNKMNDSPNIDTPLLQKFEESKAKIAELESQISVLVDEKSQLQTIIRENKSKVAVLSEEHTELEKICSNNSDEIVDLTVSVATMEKKLGSVPPEKKIASLQDSLDNTDQYARRGALTISGDCLPIYATSENSKAIVVDLLRTHCQFNLNPTEISIAHRLGKKPSGEDRRSIRFRLCRRDVASDIMAACKELKPPFFMNPSLTPLRTKLLYALRQLKKKKSEVVKFARANLKGELEAYTTVENSASPRSSHPLMKTVITTRAELEKFANDVLGMPLSSVKVDW